MVLPYPYEPGVQPNVDAQRAPMGMAIDPKFLPGGFPQYQWSYQATRYMEYWEWFSGANLAQKIGVDDKNRPIYKFPLRINVIKNFSRKHAAILLGEENYDAPEPLVKCIAEPKLPFTGDAPSDSDKKLAQIFQNLVNEVWQSSEGRALQVENATLSQFLGGCFFQLKWEPQREDLLIPITVHAPVPDFILPIWSTTDPWRLLEAYIVYRIPAFVAAKDYGYEIPESAAPVYYCEHWTEKDYSIYINRDPITMQVMGRSVTYDHLPNPFGFVPIVYIPHLREGNPYGASHVDDLRGLILEYNARMADTGDIVRHQSKVARYGRNLNNPKPRQIAPGHTVIDLGPENPAQKNPPEVYHENPPAVSPSLMEYPQTSLFQQLMREGNLSDVAFGEDEGSQRSALTLYFRMHPTTTHIRMERAFWTGGLTRLAKMMGKMMWIHREELLRRGVALPAGFDKFERKLNVSADWKPMLLQDREQVVNEVTLRRQSGTMSRKKALEFLGEHRDIEEEIDRIEEDMKTDAELNSAAKPANVQLNEPVARAVAEE